MAQKTFSAGLAEFDKEIDNADLAASLQGLVRYLGKRSLKILVWDEASIAIPLNIRVVLPPLGNSGEIDIRNIEPVIVVINKNDYPWAAPLVFPDRLDFPKDKLSHLYVAKNGKPPAFCLVRGSLNEWYANKQLKDLVIRIGNWLRDAATGELTINGDQFDPVRLEGYRGTVIYDYDQLADIVNEGKAFISGGDFAIGLFERISTDKGFAFKFSKVVTLEDMEESVEEFKKESEKDSKLPSKKNYHFGYVLWSKEPTSFSHYEVNFPHDLEGFRKFCLQFSIDTAALEKQIAEYDLNTFIAIPVIVGVKRPKKIIGFSANIEFFNFYLSVDTPDVDGAKIINNVPVAFQKHSQPLSLQMAKEISGFHADLGSYSLIIGCGALGSKIIMHLARSGSVNYVLADPDELSSHNLVRHAAIANLAGINKAVALKKEISNIFPYEKLTLLIPAARPGEVFLSPEIAKACKWMLDFTASYSFFQSLVKADIPETANVCRAFLTDAGNLGILFIEGKNRNPRIDDLQVMLYAQYKHLPLISDWLKRENANEEKNVNITVGVGCNSETTVLADDIVSLHSAFFSGVIKSETHKEDRTAGKIFLNRIMYDPYFANSPQLVEIPPMAVLSAINNPAWQIRIKPGIVETMKKEMGLAMPHETGGVFIGRANYKSMTIHVTELIPAPPDSNSNPVCFFRGIEGLPETIAEVNDMTGNQLGYIGEWHTHPFGPDTMSNIDFNTIKRFKAEFGKLPTPLPVFLMIITPTHILPYVY